MCFALAAQGYREISIDKSVINGYVSDSDYLIQAFESIDSAVLLSHIAAFLPEVPADIVDIGAGTGRDAEWLASLGHNVLAVEPVNEFRLAGQSIHAVSGIEWMKDYLPALKKLLNVGKVFDFVLIASVWQHIKDDDRKIALGNLRTIVKRKGRVAISLRNGPGAPNRKCYPVEVGDMIGLAQKFDFNVISRSEAESVQKSNQAAGVTWTWLILEAV